MAFNARKKIRSVPAGTRIPPQNIEAERAVLGAILLDGESLVRTLETLATDGSDFYSPAHQILFAAMVELFDHNTPVDIVTVTGKFKDSVELDSLGGISYLTELLEGTPTAANINYYTKIVKQKSMARRLIHAATDIIAESYESGDKVEDLMDDAERIIFNVSQERASKSFYAMKDIIKDTFEAVEKLYEQDSHITGISSGFQDLDNLTSGLQKSDLIIIAGRPGMGKTAFAVNVMENAALKSNIPVALFSLEMSKEQLTQRMLASKAKVDLKRLRNGRLREEDWGHLTNAVGALYEAPIYIDDTPAQSVLEIRAKARRWKSEYGLEMIIIDYLQLIRGKSGIDSREQEISDVSRSLKALAKELNIPVIALSQLSRRAEQREKARPQLSDLRESGAIEQDADVVMFVYREGIYNKCECPEDLTCTCGRRYGAELIVEKQRNGPTGTVPLTFIKEHTRFEDRAQNDYSDMNNEWAE